ncbi:hypothetical protein [Promicromonospora sp. NPDC019610]|uniref:hypothetical protein n=1 Tax=Promicromonospora sp. NPDC019610 TaxID=3364405 RepID=UPI003796C734
MGTLCARWRRRSLADGWRLPDDWPAPAAVRLADAVLHDLRAETHAEALGTARALSGVGVVEGLRDVAALYDVHVKPVPTSVVLAFASGWEAADAGSGDLPVRAGMSGLPRHDEFLVRATDVLSGAQNAREGRSPVLVTIDGRLDQDEDAGGPVGMAAHLARWERDVLLGEAVHLAFDADRPAGYHDGVAVVLDWSEPRGQVRAAVELARTTLARLSRHGAGVLRTPVRITVRALPDDPAALRRLVAVDEAS